MYGNPQGLVVEAPSAVGGAPVRQITSISHTYLSSFTEFISEFLSTHFGTVEGTPEFPLADLLRLLSEYLLHQPSVKLLLQCLDVWRLVVNRALLHTSAAEGTPAHTAYCAYAPALLSLAATLLSHVQFASNRAFLLRIDDDGSDDEEEKAGGKEGGGAVGAANALADALEDELEDWVSGEAEGASPHGGDGDEEDAAVASASPSLDVYIRQVRKEQAQSCECTCASDLEY